MTPAQLLLLCAVALLAGLGGAAVVRLVWPRPEDVWRTATPAPQRALLPPDPPQHDERDGRRGGVR